MNRRRSATAAVAAAALAVITCLVSVPAQADDTIRSQWWVASTGLAELKAKGLDGTGVKIAVIDAGPPNTAVPELRGANIKTVSPCTDYPGLDYISHATTVATILASPDYGWAPKASYTFYTLIPKIDEKYKDRQCIRDRKTYLAWVINEALNDGADVISVQIGMVPTPREYSAVARAALKGVPVVISTGNEGTDGGVMSSTLNTVVGVGALTRKGKAARFSNWGPSLTLMAPGTEISQRLPDANGNFTRISHNANGTSFSTPMVTGALALAMQAWPQANGNQLIRSMLYTATRPTDDYQTYFGWGILNAGKLIATDPSIQSSEIPLIDKDPDGVPTPQQVADYRDGLVEPMHMSSNDNDYVYRGTDELACEDAPRCELGTSPRFNSAAPTPAPTSPIDIPDPQQATPGWLLPTGISTLALLTIGALAIAIRRRRSPVSPPPPPSTQQPPTGQTT